MDKAGAFGQIAAPRLDQHLRFLVVGLLLLMCAAYDDTTAP